MLTFSQFITERKVEPEHLTHRTARRYGKKTSFGKWEKVKKGGHIPLSSFDGRKVRAAADREWSIRKKLGHGAFNSLYKTKTFEIARLRASQPFVRTDDVEKLRAKLKDKHPTNVKVLTYKGENFIYDGHHSVMAAKMRGDKTIDASYIDLDQFSKK